METNQRRSYTEEFKQQIVELYRAGKAPGVIIKEYKLSGSLFYKWVRVYTKQGNFSTHIEPSEEQKELKRLRKENQELKLENEILKQAALILGRK